MVRLRETPTNHGPVQDNPRPVIKLRCISRDHCSVKVYVGRFQTVKDEACVFEIGKGESAKANELERKILRLALANSYEKCLQLLEMVDMFAPFEYH